MENPVQQPTQLEKPAGAQNAAAEPVIHVIPEKFYGAALKQKAFKEPPPVAPPPPPSQAPPADPSMPPPVPAKPAAGKGRGSRLTLILVIVAVVLLLAAGGAYFFFFAKKQPAPPAPFCGDRQCSVAESSKTCPVDCGYPPPVCGDSKCEAPETTETCPNDCKPPAPVCGNSKCEAGETSESCVADCPLPTPVGPVCGDSSCDEGETIDSCDTDCKPTPGLDADSDGLSDLEENTIYGTSPTDANTDKDSFVDLNEVLHLFDPAKPDPAMLADNSGVTAYQAPDGSFTSLRPAVWAVNQKEKEVFFQAPKGEFIEILTEDKEAGKTLMDWYLAQNEGVKSSEVEVFKTPQGYDQILSRDRMTAYIAAGDKIFVVTYNLGASALVQYKVTYQMIINSLKVK